MLTTNKADRKSLALANPYSTIDILDIEKPTLVHADIRIPNTFGETIDMYGCLGLFLELLAQLILYKVTHVSANFYRTSIFLFIFIYQFTSSFFNNTSKMVLWVLPFTPYHPQFERAKVICKPDSAASAAP